MSIDFPSEEEIIAQIKPTIEVIFDEPDSNNNEPELEIVEIVEPSSPDEVTEINPLPKKRGRKPKIKTEEETKPKKRGRKPKLPTNLEDGKDGKEEVIKPRKKGRKPKDSFGLVAGNSQLDNLEYEDDIRPPNFKKQIRKQSYILHLPLTSEDIEGLETEIVNPYIYDPNLREITPKAYDPESEHYYQVDETAQPIIKSIPDNKSNDITPLNLPDKPIITSDDKKGILDNLEELHNSREKELEAGYRKQNELLEQYIEHNRRETWPTKSQYDCFWCCHSFEETPWGIPKKYVNERFIVFGNFCSPSCAAAYLFKEYGDDDETWEKFALLNMLYQRVIENDTAYLTIAPDRMLLDKFGGILTIKQFRELGISLSKSYLIKMPPMISVIPSIEEIQTSTINLSDNISNEGLAIDKDRIQKATEELRLKRTKPISNSQNTLDNYFKL